MRCDVCGLEYGLSHNCPGPLPPAAQEILVAGLEAPTDGGLGYYLGEAFKIVRWDDVAIRRNAKDRRATLYGLLVWSASTLVVLSAIILWAMIGALPSADPAAEVTGAIVGIIFGFLVVAVLTFVQLGLCHLIAKWFFGAKGKFIEVMRPLLLGYFVNCAILIPVAGIFIAGIGWAAVLMMVFEEVDEIGRLQAFGISAGINICIFALEFWMMPVTHHL